MEDNFFLNSVAQDFSDLLHRVIGNTFIITYGIVKEIPADGLVTVEMSVADSTDDVIIVNCVLACLSSASVTFDLKPNIDDKVIVFYPQSYHNAMFQKENNEALISSVSKGYTVLGGIALLLNQYQESDHKNLVSFSDGKLDLKLAYSSDDDDNLFSLSVDDKGCFTLNSNKVEISSDKDNQITVSNGKATVMIDKDGNVSVDTTGKYTFKNSVTDLLQVIDGLATELENLTTTGTPSAQQTSPASLLTINTWRSTKLNQLLQ